MKVITIPILVQFKLANIVPTKRVTINLNNVVSIEEAEYPSEYHVTTFLMRNEAEIQVEGNYYSITSFLNEVVRCDCGTSMLVKYSEPGEDVEKDKKD